MQQKETEFCGYSVPHPYEPLMNIRYSNTIAVTIIIIIIVIRLQTKEGGPTAIEVLKMGCQVIILFNILYKYQMLKLILKL